MFVKLRLQLIVICLFLDSLCINKYSFCGLLSKVMAAAGKLGQTLTVSPVGGPFKPASANGVSSEWLPAATDEEAMLLQLRAALLQARDATPGEMPYDLELTTVNGTFNH